MDNEALKKLTDVTYPDPVIFPLPNDKIAVIGPVNFEAINLIEEKFGAIEKMREVLVAAEISKKDAFSIIYILLENKDAFDDEADFARSVPLMAVPNLMQLIFHFMTASFPSAEAPADSDKETEETEGTEEKK